MNPKIKFVNVLKSFSLYRKQSDKLLEIVSFKKNKDQFFALKNINFEIYEGEAIGVIGLNGSGKSTLSNLLAQVIPPNSGKIEINGNTSLIAISAGLNNSLTGLENITIKCLMHGLKKSEIDNLKQDIIEFADLGKFINQPVKTYSSGMKSRLGFAISIHTNPDILIIDEALSVGDQTFYQKCINKINEFKQKGKTIFFISHSLTQIEAFCDRTMWIHFGQIQMFDGTKKVLGEYRKFIKQFNSLSEKEKKEIRQKMLEAQYKDEISNSTITSRMKQKKEKKITNFSFAFGLQIFTLLIICFFSACFMLGIKSINNIDTSKGFLGISKNHFINDFKIENNNKKISKNTDVKVINKEGIVTVGKLKYYNDRSLKNEIGELVFGDQVYVEKQLNNKYLIKVNGNNSYLRKDGLNMDILQHDLPQSLLKTLDFYIIFPKNFQSSYEYFFAFLKQDYNKVIDTLKGLSNETIRDNGDKILSFSGYSFHYVVNTENIVNSIVLDHINLNISEWNQLSKEASFKSVDNQYFYFITEDYDIIIDAEEKTATFKVKDESE